MLVHLEGNIASGKTTLGSLLASNAHFNFIPEPVDRWQNGFTENVLDRFYSDMKRWSFTFQICAFGTRTQALNNLPLDTITIAERSIGCDRYVFARSLYEQGAMDDLEWEVYRQVWETLSMQVPQPDAYVYLRTPAEECLNRLLKRHREEETGVSLEYLQKLEAMHDEWLLERSDVIVLDGTQSLTAEAVLEALGQKVR
jgi:deoxyadenosine/deoxycytidine kinase